MMDHLPYIAAAYGLTIGVVSFYAIGAWMRMRQAQRKLAAVDTRVREKPARR